jgi:heavy metal sensor kinase
MRGTGVRTLRGRIALWYGAIISVGLIGYSVAIAWSFARHVREELDHRVHEDIELAARAISIDDQQRPSWPGGFSRKDIEEEEGGGHWLEVWDFQGNRLLTAGTFDPGLTGKPRGEEAPRTLEIAGERVRVKTEVVRVESREFLVRAAVREESSSRQIRSLWLELAGISLTVLILGGIGGIALAHRLVGPLARMAGHARRITAEDLHERLQTEGGGEEVEHLRDAFNSTLERLESSFSQLRRFTADASHEIRTPLTALRSVGEVALQGAQSKEEYREVIGTMLEEVDRLSRLADELLAIARAESGQGHFLFERLDLARLAADVASQLEVLAEERQQLLKVRADEEVTVNGDRLSLRQALMNLIDNAIKYSPERSEVTVAVGSDGAQAVVEVIDQGAGIAPEHRERIFERFYRIDPSRSREMGGTGLGLSLVKLAAEAHGGKVEVDEREGGGSVFRFTLPLAPSESVN